MIALATEIAAVLRCERPVPRLHSTGRTYSGKIRITSNAVAFPSRRAGLLARSLPVERHLAGRFVRPALFGVSK